jgi:hypothetical protein
MTRSCQACGNEFQFRPCRSSTAKFCSVQCYNRAQHKRPTFVCNTCKEPKTPDDFTKDSSRPRGYTAICKACSSQRQSTLYRFTPARRYSEVKSHALGRGYAWELNFAQYVLICWGVPCAYCGDATNGGLDRVGNEPFYSTRNTCSCCKVCNSMKSKMTAEEFRRHIYKIVAHNSVRPQWANAAVACDGVTF